MFTKKEKFIVLDVEGNSAVRPYNIGYIVADKYGKIYKKRSVIIPSCFWENLQNALQYAICEKMHKHNIEEMLNDFNEPSRKRKYKSMSINEFWIFFKSDIKKYKIRNLYAFNVAFDNAALARLFGERYYDLKLNCRDIISGLLDTKLKTKRYLQFCVDNNYITKKNNYQYKAEFVYQYMTGNTDFIEEHTGLADVQIEYELLLWALKAKRKINWSSRQTWKELKVFAKKCGFE